MANIHVLYTLMDKEGKYSKLTGTSICSLFINTRKKVTIHIFHDGSINQENRDKFNLLAQKFQQKIVFYNVHELLPDLWRQAREIFAEAMQCSRYTEAAMYRLVAPQVLPDTIKRVIYLDSDTIVDMDIKELWAEKVGANGMAAVRETTILDHYGMRPLGDTQEPFYDRIEHVGLDNCFNSGVLLMELDKLRPMGNILLSGLRVLAEYPTESSFYDQNILNYYFAQDLTPLPWKYNILMHWDKKFTPPYKPQGILHYMGHNLGMTRNDVRDTMFYDYFLQTPWGNGEFYCRNFEVMNAVYLQLLGPRLRAMRRLAALMAVKCPVVMATAECEEMARKLFAAPDDFDIEPPKEKDEDAEDKATDEKEKKEYELPSGVVFSSLGQEDKLNLHLDYDVDKHLYLIFARDYQKIKRLLTEAGLKENEHFMSGGFLLAGKTWLEGIIQPHKFFEML